jgi:MFS family permease
MIQWARQKFSTNIPDQYRSNFFHLVGDIFWFGILNGTSLSFNTVYLTRIGGTAFHVGLLAAAPAIINMLFAIPFGSWLTRRDTAREVVISSILHRLFYLLWVPIPMLLSQHLQVWALIGITFIMYIPGTVLQVGFNDVFAEAVPSDWRGLVAGVRNAAQAATTILVSLICGQLLTRVAFPLNYEIVFFLGFLGSAVSSYHLWRVWKNLKAQNGEFIPPAPEQIPFWEKLKTHLLPDFSAIKKAGGNHFWMVILCLFGFHLTQYLAIPVFPVYWVNDLHLTDSWISIGNSLFYALVFVISTQLARMASKYGNKHVIAFGLVLMGFYPAVMALDKSVTLFLLSSVIGGVGWGMAGGVIYNYLLENVPEGNRPPFLAVYNFVLYTAILVGSLGGPFISGIIGIPQALIVFGIGRALAGLALLRWG